MPIFQEPERGYSNADEAFQPSRSNAAKAKTLDKRVKADFCDGPLPSASIWGTAGNESVSHRRDGPNHNRGGVCTSDRNELIERIKRGESPTWIPPRSLTEQAHHGPRPLLPAAELQGHTDAENSYCAAELSPPSEIKRPRSALHAGDFTQDSQDAKTLPQQSLYHEPTSPAAHDSAETSQATPWDIPPQPSQFSHIVSPTPERATPHGYRPVPSRSRAPSLNSYTSSYVAKAPTTPLVQQSNSTDLDFSPIDLSTSPSKTNRRHTLPPQPLYAQGFPPSDALSGHASAARQPPSLQRDSTFPYQTHRPRRSLTTTWSLQASPSPQKPSSISSRRQSFSSEASPLQYASMVGSYEESILRGWMSTAPSKPLDFTAQIGVMGKGNYKPKCPAHVTIPFPAVFYSWSGGPGRKQSGVDDEPSPYVGHIDLQQLPTPAESKKTRRSRSKSPPADTSGASHVQISSCTNDTTATEHPRTQKKRRRTSPAPPSPHAGYRIPQKGQLQIVIKNPNKTAVKLFLVPYDLEDMEAGTKTFIRQRCYSTDTIIDGLPSSSIKSKPTLRYLIHVNICCPSSGRYFLYQHIRVVFANRVPDNKEQLQTEIQVPQPRYNAYHSSMLLSRSVSSSSTRHAKDKAYMRRSSGFGVGHEGMDDGHPQSFGSSGTSYSLLFNSPPPPVPGIPLHLLDPQHADPDPQAQQIDAIYNISQTRSTGRGEALPFPIHGGPSASPTPAYPFQRLPVSRQRPRRDDDDDAMDVDEICSRPTTASTQSVRSPLSDKTNRHRLQSKLSDLSNGSGENGTYSKLNKGELGYGGRPPTPELGEGLLARKLRGLGMQWEARRGDGESD